MDMNSLKSKIDNLNEQAWKARINDSPKAFGLSQESVKLAREINYTKGLAEGLCSLGFCYVRLFKNDEALPLLKESLSLFESINDVRGQGVVYEYLGIIERNWGNLGASLDLLLKSHRLTLQEGTPEILSTVSYQIGVTYKHLGNYENALDYLFKSLSVAKRNHFELMEAYAINIIGSVYFDNGDYKHALEYFQKGFVTRHQSHDKWGEAGSLDNIGFTFLKLKDYNQAINYCKQSLDISQGTNDKKGQANTLLHLAEIYKETGDMAQATACSNESLEIRRTRGDKRGEVEALLFMADLYTTDTGQDAKIFERLSHALKIAEEIKAQDLFSKANYHLYKYYRRKENYKQSLVHVEAYLQTEKELHKNAIAQKVLNLEISHKAEEARKEADTVKQRNEELTRFNKAIKKQKKRVEEALAELKATQVQLIHSEKMASLGELTAGIAHEIQNPLNFVNNFSEVSKELLEEMMEELQKGDTNEVKAIANDIIENLEKVTHHGKRADSIVKGMLQHSRTSTGVKELTDINILVDEYLRLAYHGLRAKDKSFNATMKTDFDKNIGKIEVIPQDMGRVVLNLINNAFYAVNQKVRQNIEGYEPNVSVYTKRINDKIEISIKDNGNGIPDAIKEKIFQPFFTTKPTGQGTGLGLSLSYDIIQAHGGELKVITEEGKGTIFTIQLPVNSKN